MELQHFSHQHSLVFIQQQSIASEEIACCFGCIKVIDGPSYCCNECKFYLHKNCAELELASEINHLFHFQHPLTLLQIPTQSNWCNFCHRGILGFYYRCDPCDFDLHVNCALLQSSIAENFQKFLHGHPMIFIQNHKEEVIKDCNGCQKQLSGPIYHCSKCGDFNLHKECVELPLEINHPYDRIHPLVLLPNPPIHPEKCCCYLCKIKWKGFVYCCSLCKIELTPEDVSAPQTTTAASHEHPWTLLSSQISFICDFCGNVGDRTPYFCTTCHLLVHKNCKSLPRNIKITRHHHVISHSYFLQQNQLENWECRICYDQVNARYGSYSCSTSNCNYIVHVNCATNKEIWDGTAILKDKDEEDERSKEASEESINLVTIVIEEDLVAIEIKHAYHDHNLILTFNGEIKDDDNCDGCMRPLSIPFYNCEQCKFFLHKNCAELPKKKRHSFHKHLLTLTDGRDDKYGISYCRTCCRWHHGFSYRCAEDRCFFEIDIQCSLPSDTLEHPSHKCPLFVVHNYEGKCSGCLQQRTYSLAYRCTKRCDFTLDLRCATLPLTACYKYDRHLLTLTYFDDSDPCQHYCDLCERERNPNHWFYYCTDCDNSLHSNCALGELPLFKIGRKIGSPTHPHPLTFVKNIWNCPPCIECGELCNGQTLECKETECNFSVHWECFQSTVNVFGL